MNDILFDTQNGEEKLSSMLVHSQAYNSNNEYLDPILYPLSSYKWL